MHAERELAAGGHGRPGSPAGGAGEVDAQLHPLEAAAEQRRVLLRIVRMAFVVAFATITVLAMLSAGPGSDLSRVGLVEYWPLVLVLAIALGGTAVVIDALTPKKKIGTLVSIFLGLMAAMAATLLLGFLIDLLAGLWEIGKFDPATGDFVPSPPVTLTKVLVGITLAYLCVTTVLQTQDDFRLVIPYVEFAKELRGPRPLLLDSSALIDARIVDVAGTGILQSPLVIPRFVIGELQLMADSGDKLKRGRGRRGLDAIGRLQRSAAMDVSIDEMPVPGKSVDQMLVELARRMPAVIVTTDTGLNRVAAIQGVRVLNLNEVANALKSSAIPGEQMSVRLLKPGEQPGQAVGYLDDGTMVVAEDGIGRVGQEVTLIVTSALQTAAGRLIFGRVFELPEPAGAAAAGAPAGVPGPEGGGAAAAEAGGDAGEGPGAGDEERGAGGKARGPFPPKRARPNPARNPRR